AADDGLMPVVVEMVGPGTAVMLNATRLEAALFGFCTLTKALPAAAINGAGTRAVNCEELTKAVVSACGEPPEAHCTLAPLTKLEPVMLSWNAAPPATAEEGKRPPGLRTLGPATALIVKTTTFDVALPGFSTLTNA